jgi:ribosome maturation factor RimP
MFWLAVACWVALGGLGVRRLRRANSERLRLFTTELGHPVIVVSAVGRRAQISTDGDVVAVDRHRVVIESGGDEVVLPIAAVRELWRGQTRLGSWS